MNSRQSELERELNQVSTDMWAVVGQSWGIKVGPIRVRRRIGSQLFAKLYVLFNLGLAMLGGLLIFAGESASDLGIALVVGALFSFGAFLTEVWSQTVDGEQEALDAIFGEERRDKLRRLQKRRAVLLAELDVIAKPHG
jgi:hypothetical protein